MRALAYKLGCFLLVLIAWLLLGGSRANAAFLIQTNGLLESSAVMSDAELGQDDDFLSSPNQERGREALDRLSRLKDTDFVWWSGLAQAGSGCGSAAAGPSVSGSGPGTAAISSAMNLSPSQVVRWLYFADMHYRPPPFASRLFRPPRLF
jgi:hypothetical protein